MKAVDPNLETFLFSAVHDMKNSITVLAAAMEQLLPPPGVPGGEAYRDVGQMFYEVKRMNGNLTHLLTLYKLGMSSYPFDPQDHLLTDFIDEVLAHQDAVLRSAAVAIEVEVDDDLVWTFDEYLISSVVAHALNNASKYTRSKIRLLVREHARRLELRIEDDGAGYPASMLETPPGSLSLNSQHNSGTGLGLYFASVVAGLHRHGAESGRVALENGGSLGGGVFILVLP
ncbi:sensor histidine kinase [Parachitinimonas caeni]|uniref:histidine kinase n=1 Tax=Parachitinimonas caeni TaxID=3031301 RepID=A0ABT7DXW1_9NEIS|nr:HAMP domain-containing sensor histidine kinase [Parachitinimonas caeni]MDK2123923.1 HAMP domain-containing sensor histidine kinase [Parachitinimonas caeni]